MTATVALYSHPKPFSEESSAPGAQPHGRASQGTSSLHLGNGLLRRFVVAGLRVSMRR
jgi:hypothetical protein